MTLPSFRTLLDQTILGRGARGPPPPPAPPAPEAAARPPTNMDVLASAASLMAVEEERRRGRRGWARVGMGRRWGPGPAPTPAPAPSSGPSDGERSWSAGGGESMMQGVGEPEREGKGKARHWGKGKGKIRGKGHKKAAAQQEMMMMNMDSGETGSTRSYQDHSEQDGVADIVQEEREGREGSVEAGGRAVGEEVRMSVEVERSAVVKKRRRRRSLMRSVRMGGWRGPVSDDVLVAEFKQRDEKDKKVRKRKPRVVWSEKLHARFVAAVNVLGVEQAVPRAVLDLMNVSNLTRENVASHLQKYRNTLRSDSERRQAQQAQQETSAHSQHEEDIGMTTSMPMDADDTPLLSLGSASRSRMDQ